ncbi:hypothetical protein EV421DRAFT_2025240 [Armillaria borealis]|uniref:Uncharacterized protein n=1 Tax=Armillaria borealis TaxID=47425 RepID=A0AA39IV12_9AGAR|nr:hypothetical protein EV421DRAFT_2025240 [Armillaria borealis]
MWNNSTTLNSFYDDIKASTDLEPTPPRYFPYPARFTEYDSQIITEFKYLDVLSTNVALLNVVQIGGSCDSIDSESGSQALIQLGDIDRQSVMGYSGESALETETLIGVNFVGRSERCDGTGADHFYIPHFIRTPHRSGIRPYLSSTFLDALKHLCDIDRLPPAPYHSIPGRIIDAVSIQVLLYMT